MTSSNQTVQDEAMREEPSREDVPMRHPDLKDVVRVPWFAVEGYEQRGYEHVEVDDDGNPVEKTEQAESVTVPAPTGATSTRATTSGTARTPSSDGGSTANPTD